MTVSHEGAGRRERKKQQTRTALLGAAMSLFREHGIYGTRVADITGMADVGKGVFYNYFDTKEALVAELVRDGLELLEREYFMTMSSTATLEERVNQLARLHEEFFEKYPDYAIVIHQSRGLLLFGERSNQAIRDVFHEYLTRMSRWLPPPAERTAWSQEVLLDIAAALAGAVSGYRSFRMAAGLHVTASTISAALSIGVPTLLERQRTT